MAPRHYIALLPLGPVIVLGVTLLVHYGFGQSWFYFWVPSLWVGALVWVVVCLRELSRRPSN